MAFAIVSQEPHARTPAGVFLSPGVWKSFSQWWSVLRDVRLLQPAKHLSEPPADWMRLPDFVDARELVCPPVGFMERRRIVMRNAKTHLQGVDWLDIRHPSYEAYYTGIVAKKLKIPIVAELHGDWHEVAKSETNKSLLRKLTRKYRANKAYRIYCELVAEARGVISIGPALAEKYVPKGKPLLVTANNVVEEHDFFARTDFSLKTPPRILFVAALHWTKGLQPLFEAMTILKSRGQEFQLVVAGVGEAQKALQQYAEKEGFADRVHFAGVVPHGSQLYGEYRKADVFVLPSLSEGVARVIHEAMSQGCPAVSTNVGGTPWLLRDGAGLMVPPSDPQALAEAILSVLRDESLRRRLSEQGFQAAREHCFEKQREEIADFLQTIVPRELLTEQSQHQHPPV